MPAADSHEPPIAPPRQPHSEASNRRSEAERQQSLQRRARLERSSILRGLLLFATAALVFSILRAGLYRAFVPGWWRQW